MKSFIFFVSVLFLVQSLNAWVPKETTVKSTSGFGDCSFKKIEKDKDGVTVFLNCVKEIGQKQCYVQKDRKGYQEIESGNIWKQLDQKRLTATRDEDNGRQNLTKHKNGKITGTFIGDCIAFYTKKTAFDFITGKYMNAIQDKIDLPFTDHPELIGKWNFIDYVKETRKFDPAKKQWNSDFEVKGISFMKNGKTNKPYWTWTKDMVIHNGDVTASKYEIKKIGEKDYLFLEEKNGDYIYRHQTPRYIVFERVTKKK